ncbi:DUF1120 domain-containing protein [Pantoea dispersa]|jgi:type 1 fimbria pilin|uniref:DUF1120 domain-containing protein n=1 Tax=Pantoea dispersa TaxID=59814 RepID=UPI001BA9E3CD|nr:DUF1120 domain-containing protein [Pantoea dispersa]MBS0897217.1 DUF1120 domain-containing protein [Pantoea dispersa]MCT6592102.1 DUF1120 domain-containing protein [Pantoea dispersa]
MMKKMMKTTCALVVLAASCNVMAESVDMRVTGAVTPIACKPVLANNGIVDYGNINTNILSNDNYTFLPSKDISLTISCTAPAKIALLATNARLGSTLSDIQEGPSGTAWPIIRGSIPLMSGVAGLGMDGDKKIGAYTLISVDTKADGESVKRLRSSDKTSWTGGFSDSFFDQNGNFRYMSWYKDDLIEPVAFKNLTSTIRVMTYINKASELDLTKPVKLDGQTNFEMFYL